MLELFLLIAAITLLYVLLPIISIFVFIKRMIAGEWRLAKVWFYTTAREIDIFGNFIGAPLFNETLIKKGGYKFGVRGETISSVIGKNYMERKLTWIGKIIRRILDSIETDHCLISIQDQFTNTKK